VFFFVHTLLWAFAPWCLLFYFALYKNFREIFQKRKLVEYYTLSGGILLLLLFSFSRFQLPFYTNTIFPLFAVITAPYCYTQLSKAESNFRLIGQWAYIILFPLAILLINFYSKPENETGFIVDCALFVIVALLIFTRIERGYKRVFMLNCAAALFVNLYLNTVFYEELTAYQGQITAAKYINQKQFDTYKIYSLRTANNIFQFYCNRPVDYIPLDQFNNFKVPANSAFFATQTSLDTLLKAKASFKIIESFTDYPQENILPGFIDKNTRNSVLSKVYLISK